MSQRSKVFPEEVPGQIHHSPLISAQLSHGLDIPEDKSKYQAEGTADTLGRDSQMSIKVISSLAQMAFPTLSVSNKGSLAIAIGKQPSRPSLKTLTSSRGLGTPRQLTVVMSTQSTCLLEAK